MTARDDLAALAARVEAAEVPSRELDAEISVAVNGGVILWKTANGTMEMHPMRRYPSPAHIGGFGKAPVPAYTASLDAAASLAGEWVIASLGDMVADGLPGAVLLLSTNPVRHVTGVGYGTRESGCLARALTAAALRARAAIEKDTPHG